ncbi:tol-pal system YbgF family protein, partial [Planctomycetota bacterium]
QPGREREVLEKVMTLMPEGQVGSGVFWEAATRLSREYKKADQNDQARKVYEKIIQKYPQPDIRTRAEKELKKLK